MYNLHKNIGAFSGIPPYASEKYGIVRSLLGWESQLTKQWIQRDGKVFDPKIKQILDENIKVEKFLEQGFSNGQFYVLPLIPGKEKSPYLVILKKDLKSELLNLLLEKVQLHVESSDGQLPKNDEWVTIIKELKLGHPDSTALHKVKEKVNLLLLQQMRAEGINPVGLPDQAYVKYTQKHLEIMRYESQIATFLLKCAENVDNPEFNPSKLFSVQKSSPLSDLFSPTNPLNYHIDPLANIDPESKNGALAPIGRIDLFRQLFFDLGTFLGEPVEHIWLSPGTTIELYEISTRKTIVERTQEAFTETLFRSEEDTSQKDELSDAIKTENKNSTKMGVSVSSTGKTFFAETTATANYGTEANTTSAKETMHKTSKELTNKLSSEIKQSFKSTFKTVTETTDTTSRRHMITNPTNELRNYELRRKMRRVGVQLQHIGERLCWQMFIDNPGAPLGLSELVHLIDSPDLSQLTEPVEIQPPANEIKTITVPFPLIPVEANANTVVNYVLMEPVTLANQQTVYLGAPDFGRYKGQIYMEYRFKINLPPKPDYILEPHNVRFVQVQTGKKVTIHEIKIEQPGNVLHIILGHVNFGGEHFVNLDFELTYTPTDAASKKVDEINKANRAKYDAEKNELIRKSYIEAVRKRIKDASNIKQRPSWDLREEERVVVYRKLIERLMMDSWKLPNNSSNQRLAHVRSEVVRSLFDVDNMLYFVAPEWWMPRLHPSQLNVTSNLGTKDNPFVLSERDIVKWNTPKRKDNYKITEESTPARLGSSLGWLMQLDGDNLRNAFLNAPWVKAVIPIRPGRETAALNWLKSIEGHQNDGWDAPYLGTEPEYVDMTVGAVLEKIANDMQQKNKNVQHVLEADKVYEHGFSHLAEGFDASLDNFSQSISILPTDQIVAVEYKPTDLLINED
ncbi:hypothetical protein NKS31_28100 [Bacillus sp. 1813sda1]|uniref:Uncharacterized protein n=1 Tax=Bacillus anthracis TaxID=1392 RepID=A0A2A7D1S6_BACAN|nr:MULTISPECIES: hypothetical protein [Bacillus]MCP1166805.1 hypothetical protein [Bacillus sp. 1813sda1]PDZ13925.1 hypothetical protein CON16_27310 [Bacillus anthracis]